jgi:two-component system, LytTR family, sensor histidine kinase AlgZ
MSDSTQPSTAPPRAHDAGSFEWAGTLRIISWTLPAIALVVSLLLIATEHPRVSDVWIKLLASFIYSVMIGFPSTVLLNWAGFRFANRFPRFIIVINAAVLLFTSVAGTLAGSFVFAVAGIIPRGSFWNEFRGSYPIALIVTLVFGLAISSFETMRHRLQHATLELRTRQVEQERAYKLLAEARLSSLESRIHPHFLFNTLNSIAALIPLDPKRAEDTVGKLASLLRFSLNAHRSGFVPLAQEVKIVRDYLEIESTRYGPRLRYSIEIPAALDDAKIPPLALQSLVENAIKHVAAQRAEGATIDIAGRRDGDKLHLEVTDDGPGFTLDAIRPEHGLGNLIARLELLHGDRGRLGVARRGNLTVVSLELPAEA